MLVKRSKNVNYHIVRTNETIEKIAMIYNLDVMEIKELNTHIRSWNNLIPGVKIKLPEIPESVTTSLNDVEPFIEDYYPKITTGLSDFDLQHSNFANEVKAEVINQVEEENPISKPKPIQSQNSKQLKSSLYSYQIPPYYVNNPYYNPYMYYPNYYGQTTRRKK